MAPPFPAERARVAAEPLHLALQAIGPLRRERVLERETLAAERDLVLVLGVGPVPGLPQQRDDPDVGDQREDARGREGVEEVARAGLADDPPFAPEREAVAMT